MNNYTYHFCIPTPWRDPINEPKCVNGLSKVCQELKLNYKIFFVCNESSLKPGFHAQKFEDPNIIKLSHDLNYSISRSINMGAKESVGKSDFFCFVQSDIFFNDLSWLQDCIDLYEKYEDVGVIGCRPHSTFENYNIVLGEINNKAYYKVLWSDGIMFFKTSHFEIAGLFDEGYFGDKESQDFCYKLHDKSYHNIWLPQATSVIHESTQWHKKTNTDPSKYMQCVADSGKLFKNKWHHWEQTHINLLKSQDINWK